MRAGMAITGARDQRQGPGENYEIFTAQPYQLRFP
jgi:hypothetical protein